MTTDLRTLALDMAAAVKRLSATPDDQEWAMDDLDAMETARREAQSLIREIEATVEAFFGAAL